MQAAEVQGPGLLLVLFLGDRIASVGKSWCPGKSESFSGLFCLFYVWQLKYEIDICK